MHARALVAVGLAVAFLALLPGCATRGYFQHREDARAPDSAALPDDPWPPRALVMYGGHTGRIITWHDLMEAVRWADVIIIGERHDDAVGHEVERAIVEDVLATYPGSVVTMEMFERDDQGVLDAYLAGDIDEATLVEEAGLAGWGFGRTWGETYGPIVDEARDAGEHVVAANAPRKYVKMARAEGFEAMQALPAEERALFDIPKRVYDEEYWQRFSGVSHGMGEGDGPKPKNLDMMRNGFRSQQMWDATMAQSMANARRGGATKVVHVVGQFHSDYDGGLVTQYYPRDRVARLLTISMQPVDARELLPADRLRADVVIYTGEQPDPEPVIVEEAPPAEEPAGDEGAPPEIPRPTPPTEVPRDEQEALEAAGEPDGQEHGG